MLHVPESLTLVFHHFFLPVRDILGALALFLQALGGIDAVWFGHGERFFDGRDKAEEQHTGRHDANDKDENSFKIFHGTDSIR